MTTATAQPASVKERPIIFGAPMVRAILDGRKTQTRRVAKFGEVPGDVPNVVVEPYPGEWVAWWTESTAAEALEFSRREYKPGDGIQCPYGKPGERLWVKEWIQYIPVSKRFTYADGVIISHRESMRLKHHSYSPRFCPRATSRITLEITGVRVERLKDISNEDAVAEGVSTNPDDYRISMDGKPATCEFISSSYAFACLWNRIHGDGAFGKNPWVWVIEFKRLM